MNPTVSIGAVLGDPIACATELAILRGDSTSGADGLNVRNNRRDYYSQGIHVVLGITPKGIATHHEIEVGVRYHEDEEDRFQEEDGYRMNAAGLMKLTSLGVPGSQANRVSTGESLALFVKATIRLGDWPLTPGARFESIDFERIDYGDAARTVVSGRRRNGLDEIIPGIGVAYNLSPGSSLFGGIHRGFAPPGPSAVDTDAEESINYEFGYRMSARALTTELVGFYSDYSNLLGACTVSSGCSSADVGDVFDGGEVEVRGLEASLNLEDLTRGRRSGITLTEGEVRSSFDSDYDPWGNVEAGFELPYLPEHQLTLGSGVTHDRWSVFANFSWVDQMRTVAGHGAIPREISTDSHLLLDVSAGYKVKPQLKLFVQGRNLTDETVRDAQFFPQPERTVAVRLVGEW